MIFRKNAANFSDCVISNDPPPIKTTTAAPVRQSRIVFFAPRISAARTSMSAFDAISGRSLQCHPGRVEPFSAVPKRLIDIIQPLRRWQAALLVIWSWLYSQPPCAGIKKPPRRAAGRLLRIVAMWRRFGPSRTVPPCTNRYSRWM